MKRFTCLLCMLLVTGCGGSTRLSFATSRLPAELAAWQQVKRPEVPTVFVTESGGTLYLMPFLGDCAKPGYQARVEKVARAVGDAIWVVVKARKASDDRAAQLVKTSSRYIRVRHEKGLVLQLDGVKPFHLSLVPTGPEFPGYRYEARAGDYQCDAPLK